MQLCKEIHGTIMAKNAVYEEDGTTQERSFDLVGDGETGGTNWTKCEILGRGKTSEYYRATTLIGGFQIDMAVKLIQETFNKNKPVIEEDEKLRELSQINLLKYFGYCTSDKTVFFFFEFFKGVSLEQYIQENGSSSEDVIRKCSQQILEGVAYLHSKQMTHRNLKSCNILVDEETNIKITDFCIAKYCTDFIATNVDCNRTYRFIAPEYVIGCILPSSDIWSLGCIVVHMLTGKIPYHDMDEHKVISKLKKKSKFIVNNLPEKIPFFLNNFIKSMLMKNPDDRPTADFLLYEDAFICGRYISNVLPMCWRKGQFLGGGRFGKVYQIVDDLKNIESTFAVKEIEIPLQIDSNEISLKREAEILLMLESHERIVPFYGFFTNKRVISILLGYMAMGSLVHYYKDNGPISEEKCRQFTRQILEGLVFLHEKRIVHRDIKGLNILLENEDRVRLTDFGISKFLDAATSTFTSTLGSDRWMAPEIVNNEINKGKHGCKADIWSLGCTVVEMITGEVPYCKLPSNPAVIFNVGNGLPPDFPEEISEELRQFLSETFVVNPNDRKSSLEMLDVSFVRNATIPHVMPLQSGFFSNIITEDEVFADSMLHKDVYLCKKNPGHTHFIPIKAFKIDHLPVGYQDRDLFQLAQSIASMTVKMSIKMVSYCRPQFWPDSVASYPFYTKRNNTNLRFGSGIIQEVIKYINGTNKKDKTNLKFCQCSKCINSEKPSDVWAKVVIHTTAHVIFDDIEAKYTSVTLFYDESVSPMVILEKCCAEEVDIKHDLCRLVCITCDTNLIDNIEKTLKSFENLRFKVHNKYKDYRDVDKCAFIVSHPHGASKHISFGSWVKKINAGQDEQWIRFTYTTPTCLGSGGAHVHIVGYSGRVWHCPLLHCGRLVSGLNYSNIGFVA